MKKIVFCGVSFIIPELFGMKFGEVKSQLQEPHCFTEVIEESFGLPVQSAADAESLLNEVTRAFEVRKARNEESGANILFYKGKVFINGYEPTYTFDNFYLRGIKYQPVQLYGLLGFQSELVSLLFRLDEILDLIDEAIKSNYYSVIDFWKEACGNSAELDNLLHNYIRSTPEFLDDSLNAAADLFKLVEFLGLKHKTLNNSFLFQVNEVAQIQFKKYLDAIGGYISFFSSDNGDLFLRNVKNMSDYIHNGSNLLYIFREYFHTEFLVAYDSRDSRRYPLRMVSYYDFCDNCERFWARITPQQDGVRNVIAVSAVSYKDSRGICRSEFSTNKSFLQIRLNDFSYLKNTDTAQNIGVNFLSQKRDPAIFQSKMSGSSSQRSYDPYVGILKGKSQNT